MGLSKQSALIVIMFLVPAICCFVGIGAFVHVLLAAEREAQAQTRDQQAKLQEQLDNLLQEAGKLQQAIAEAEKRIQELSDKLAQAKKDGETAEELDTDISRQKELLATLLARLAALRDQIVQKQKEIDSLQSKVQSAGPLDAQLEQLRKQLAELDKAMEEARAERNRLAAQRDELRRRLDEAEDTREILPGRSRPGEPPPIYLECSTNSVVIQPEGTQLGPSPSDDDRRRFMAAAQRAGYVVFLIRPDGLFSFYQYRDLLVKEGLVTFGWEPIDASWKLEYPNQQGH